MGWNFKVKFFQKNLDCLAKLFSLVQCKLVKKSKLMHAKCKQLFHSSTFRILHWNFEPPLLILDTEKWGQTRVWKPRRIGVGRVKGGIKRETRAGPEMGVLKEWELGEIRRNHATMLNIVQLKKNWREAKKNRLGAGNQGTGVGRFEPPVLHQKGKWKILITGTISLSKHSLVCESFGI